jgi:hypothetical protein
MDAKINKQLKNDEIILRCIPRGGSDVTEHPKQRVTTAMVLNKLNEFIEEQREHNTSVDYRLKEIDNRLNEHSIILNKHSAILNEHLIILEKHSQILEKHSDILNRNNLI